MASVNRGMSTSAHSVGSLVKKILVRYPDLGSHEMIQVIRKATRTRGVSAGEYASAEFVDEKIAMQLAADFVKNLKV